MFDIVITDSEEFRRIIHDLERNVTQYEDSFRLQNRNFSMIDGTDNYRGECQSVISEKYKEFTNNYGPIIESLKNYIKFLKITIQNYENQENAFNESIENNLENLDVN